MILKSCHLLSIVEAEKNTICKYRYAEINTNVDVLINVLQ